MPNSRNRHPARRRFLKQAAALSAGAAAVSAPLLVLAQPSDDGPATAAREAGPSASPRRPPRAGGPV